MMNLCITFPTPSPLSFPALSFSALTVTNWQSDWVERRKQNQYKANIMYMKSKLILSPSHLSSVYFEGHFYRYGFLGSRKLSIHIKKISTKLGHVNPKTLFKQSVILNIFYLHRYNHIIVNIFFKKPFQ